jgi:septal ring factor EnvC (AmiA/AmiB activator)
MKTNAKGAIMKKILTSAVCSLAMLAGTPALAQQSQSEGNQNPQATSAQKENYSDKELKKFAKVQENIKTVREEYVPKIKSAESQNKAKELQMKANDQMVKAIKQKGLDIPTYNAIASAYNSQPEVRDRVDAMM